MDQVRQTLNGESDQPTVVRQPPCSGLLTGHSMIRFKSKPQFGDVPVLLALLTPLRWRRGVALPVARALAATGLFAGVIALPTTGATRQMVEFAATSAVIAVVLASQVGRGRHGWDRPRSRG